MVFELQNLGKNYGDLRAVDGVSFGVEAGEIVSIIGPSGSGKTTLLKLIAGIEEPTTGEVRFQDPVGKQHPAIIVFQDYVLFPHLTVFENIAFGLRVRKEYSRRLIHQKVAEIMSYFGISDKAKDYPARLSGGQRQRVAIARAMVVEPHVLLLDEPFANLDRNLKLETALFIRDTQKRFGVTTVAVTHDLEEAFVMSDKIGILLDGRLAQFDTSRNVYFDPASFSAAEFLGPVNRIPASVLPLLHCDAVVPAGADVVCARAEGLALERDEQGPGEIVDVCFIGVVILYSVRISGITLKVHSLIDGLEVGDPVQIRLLKFFSAEEKDTKP